MSGSGIFSGGIEGRRADPSALRSYISSLYARGTIQGEDGRTFDLFPAGVTVERGEILRELALRESVTSTIETGLAFGLSALFLCEALIISGRDDAIHVAMDPFQKEIWGNSGLCNLRQAGLAGLLEFYSEPSQLVLPRLLSEGRSFDIGFVDGDHRFDGAFVDLYFMHALIRPGGLIVVDDLWMPSVRCAVSFFETNLGYRRERGLTSESRSRRRRLLSWKRRSREYGIACLRRPKNENTRPWDHFVPFH